MQRREIRTIAAAALALVATSMGAAAFADDLVTAPMIVELKPFVGSRHGLFALTRGRVTVVADGAVCASAVPTSDRVPLSIGTSDQPRACRRAGASLSLENGAGQPLHATLSLESGGRVTVTNFAPRPPHAAGAHAAPAAPRSEASSTSPASLFGPLFAFACAAAMAARRSSDRRRA